MRKWLTIAGGGLMVAACGGGGDSSSGGTVPVVPAATPTPTVTPTPTATPTPAATPAPTPTPTSSYTRYADLTGARSFQTACAAVLLNGAPPVPQPVLSFGEGPTLDRSAAGGWAISGDGVALSFGTDDAVASASGQRSYERTVGGSVQRLTVIDTSAGGTTLDYLRSYTLRTDRSAGSTSYACVFGVPVLAADLPGASFSYARVGVSGTAYVADQAGAVQTYVLIASTGTARYDAATGAVVVSVRLLGNLQTAGGTASATTDLGTFTGSGTVDAARGRFYGQLDSSDRISLFSSFGGWFFGPTEAGAAFEVFAADPGTGNRVSVVGTLAAAR